MDIGDVTKKDVEGVVAELMAKVEVVGTIVELMVLKYEKYSLEYNNMQAMIKLGKKDVEREL